MIELFYDYHCFYVITGIIYIMYNLIAELQSQLDKTLKTPLYEQFISIVKNQIRLEHLKKGDFLPSEREFTEQLAVSRITIRKALALLEKEHVITRIRGYGTIINDSLEYSLKTVKGFSQQILLRGQKPNTIWINKQLIEPSDTLRKILDLNVDEKVFILKRIRYIDDSPVSIEESFVPAKLIDNVDNISLSLYSFFRERNIIPIHIKSRVNAALSDEAFNKAMCVTGVIPVLVIKQIVYDENDIPIEYSINHCRGDKYTFTSDE